MTASRYGVDLYWLPPLLAPSGLEVEACGVRPPAVGMASRRVVARGLEFGARTE